MVNKNRSRAPEKHNHPAIKWSTITGTALADQPKVVINMCKYKLICLYSI